MRLEPRRSWLTSTATPELRYSARIMIAYEQMTGAVGLDWYAVDPNLRLQMDRFVESPDRTWVEEKLHAMGALIGGPVAENAEIIDKHGPELVRWDRSGEEINRVVHHPATLDSKRRLWKAGFLGLAFTDEVRRRGRPVPQVLGAAYSYLLSQADTGMLCGVSMTNGVLSLVERYADEATRERFAPGLRGLDYDRALDGSMFLTERAGGSDLAQVETRARFDGQVWRLDGFKWFCSNVDGRALTVLARPEGAPAGIRGLAVFLVPKTLDDGTPNGIHIRRIKSKLGTRSVATGEIDFVNTVGYMLAGRERASGPDERGINRMMEFVTGSRLGVAAMGAGITRRVFLEAAIYASHRTAFGRKLEDHGMVRETLVDLAAETEAACALLFGAHALLDAGGRPREGQGPLVRILVPLTKLRCTRQAIACASAALEIHGGNGYIEDWPMARQLRDAQCHTIWEGTENVLALDVLRAMSKERAHEALLALVESIATRATDSVLEQPRTALRQAAGEVVEALGWIAQSDPELVKTRARRFAQLAGDLAAAALLLDEATWELRERGSARKAVIASWFARAHLMPERCRGITSRDRTLLDLARPLVRYGEIAPAQARAALGI